MSSQLRIACIDLPAFPLQLARRAHPEWQGQSVVVVDQDSPRGVVLWANECARRQGILPGLRYAAGLSLDAQLRAGVVAPADISAAIEELTEALRRFSPTVEPSPVDADPGLFWLDASGLSLLYPSLEAWADAVRAALGERGLTAGVAVGFSRFGSYATARALAGRARVVWRSPVEERAAARRVPLSRTALDGDTRAALAQLGVHTLGQLAELPQAGLRRRFGGATQRLHQLATFTREEPLQPAAVPERFEQHLDLDDPVTDREVIGFLVKQLLDPLLGRLAGRALALSSLTLGFHDPPRPLVEETLRPAAPTLDASQLHGLIRLRLEHLALPNGARGISLSVEGRPATREQLTLFFEARPRRDLKAGERALARLRAALGDQAVVRARLRSGHLPEAGFAWEPIASLADPRPRPPLLRALVRRVLTRPELLPPRPAREPDGWMPRGFAHGPVERLVGPFCISGGWWNEAEVRRDYYFAEHKDGLLWLYYDHRRRRWCLHGESL